MAKKEKASKEESKTSDKPKTAKGGKKKSERKGLFLGLGLKFSFFVGMLLVIIMITITVFIYRQNRDVLGKEVKARGAAIAKNIANNASDPLFRNDDLPLVILTKEAVQFPMKEDTGTDDLLTNMIEALKNDLLQVKAAEEIKNEGIMEAVIVKKPENTIASANDMARTGETYTLAEGIKALTKDDDILIQEYMRKGRKFFDVGVPIGTTVNGEKYLIGEVHLTISRSIIDKVVILTAVKIGLIVLIALVLGIFLSIILVNIMVNPIKFLVEGFRKLGEGDFNVHVKVKSNDEIGVLTEAFNETTKSLKEKELLKQSFQTYVSSAVMDEILGDPTKLSLHGARVRATMLFTDIRGFTSMSENLQPEEVVAVINEYLTLQTDKVFKWKGVLDKFVGDCVMAVYGVPRAREHKQEDAYRAVRTAMDIREGVEKLNVIRKRRNQICVGIGIGVNTGDVVAGNMGSPQKMDYTVIGDNVNLAARLEANAPAGAVWCSESAMLDCKDYIEFTELESIKVKGKKEPVRVFEPVRVREGIPLPWEKKAE